jgi:hypothetical protein
MESGLSLTLPSPAKNPLVCSIKQAGEGLGVRDNVRYKLKNQMQIIPKKGALCREKAFVLYWIQGDIRRKK